MARMTVGELVSLLAKQNPDACVSINARTNVTARTINGETQVDAFVTDVRDMTAEAEIDSVVIFAEYLN